MITRRSLLTGAGGVIVGAGAASGTAAGLWPSTPGLPAVTPNEELMYDHGVLKRVLLCYRAMSARLSAGSALPADVLANTAQLVRDYTESYHEGLEEAYVFPRLQQAGQHTDVVATLLTQHDRGRWITSELLDLAANGAGPGPLVSRLDAFVRMYEPHEAWEDTMIFPAFRAITPDKTWRLLAEKFASEQDRLFGKNTMQNMLEQVAAAESALGIGDLAAFTPPE